MSKTILDITQPLSEQTPVWPGDPPVEIARAGGLPSVSRLTLGSHAGTHVDPPAHFLAGGLTADQLPLEILVGPAWVAHLPGPGPITPGRLSAARIPPNTQRLLLRTDNSGRCSPAFDPDFVGIGLEAAEWLLGRGIRLVGIDGPSIEPFDSPGEPVHHALLGSGTVVVEGLDLAAVPAGPYELVCLPLRIVGGDGAPLRAILISDQ